MTGTAAEVVQPGGALGGREASNVELHVVWLQRVARRRDRKAFEQLYAEYAPRIFRRPIG